MKPQQTADAVKSAVRETYARIATTGARGCGCDCGGGVPAADLRDTDGRDIPEGADMGLGSGNPLALVFRFIHMVPIRSFFPFPRQEGAR